MTTVIEKLRPTFSKLMGVVDRLGLRYYDVQIKRQSFTKPADSIFSGPYSGVDISSGVILDITELDGYRPSLERVSGNDFVRGFSEDTEFVLSVTRDWATGGTTYQTLEQTLASDDDQIFYLVTGPGFPNGAKFAKTTFQVTGLTFRVGLKRIV
jgi:hypothetical protein